jgi:RND superfamily putative drug exporter
MSSALYALGCWVARAKGRVVLAWAVVLALLAALALTFGHGLDDSITIPGLESSEALAALGRTFPEASGTNAQFLILAPEGHSVLEPGYQDAIDQAAEQLNGLDQVALVTLPQDDNQAGISADRRAALLTAQVRTEDAVVTQATRDGLDQVQTQLQAALPSGAEASLGGGLFSYTLPRVTLVEVFGIAAALVVLIVNFGSLLAAGMPLLVSLAGVGVTTTGIFLATAAMSINSTTPILSFMLGTAVGIDYSLFIISRHRQQLRQGVPVVESIGRALATSGSAVVFAGLTVIVALLGLGVAGIPFLTIMGISAAVGVAMAVATAETLLPAVLAAAGDRLRPGRRRTGVPEKGVLGKTAAGKGAFAKTAAGKAAAEPTSPAPAAPAPIATAAPAPTATPVSAATTADPALALRRGEAFFRGWLALATSRPILTVVAVALILGAAAIPMFGLRLALPDAGWRPRDDHARITYDRISEHFGEGVNATLAVTATVVTSTDPVALMTAMADDIRQLDGVAAIPVATPNRTGDIGIVQITPTTGPSDAATQDLVHRLRGLRDDFKERYGVDIKVTGLTAVMIDVSDRLAASMVPFALIVVGLSYVLLTLVFRSLWVPLKAAGGYLLSVGAAFGTVVLVFQHGLAADLLNVARVGPIIAFMPIVVMGVLFGLAMDYELFLVSRMREAHARGRPARQAIQEGFLGSSRVVTCAAIIMFVVFTGFIPESDQIIKPMALGLTVGVFADAFLVRMTLVPAVLTLLGERAWWLPRWLDRRLPQVDVEGQGLARQIELEDWPEPGSQAALAARDVPVPTAQPDRTAAWTTLVERGQVHLVRTPDAVAGTAALLLASGRLRPDGGWLKSLGLVCPGRAGAVRRRSVYLDLAAGDPAKTLCRALAEQPDLLALDGCDRLTAAVRAELRPILAGRPPQTTVLLTAWSLPELVQLIDPDTRSDLSPAPSGAAHTGAPT